MLCFESNIIPSDWRRAIVCPIFKDINSVPRIPLNYRGISLLSTINKIYSSVLNNRLVTQCVSWWTKRISLRSLLHGPRFHTQQYNSNQKRNFRYIHWFTKSLRHSWPCTFETLLLCNGIDGDFYNAIKSIYENTTSCVRIDDLLTEWFTSSAGVRQGDDLSPTLFALFINDLAKEVKILNKGTNRRY